MIASTLFFLLTTNTTNASGFWQVLEAAWAEAPAFHQQLQQAVVKPLEQLEKALEDDLLPHYEAHLQGYDDIFLYGRCFVLGMGEAYYNRID